jgi:hypothetical protein
MDPDTLDAMFGNIADSSSPFGGSGCFTAGCELLAKRGFRSLNEKVAQSFLVLLLNREAGFICDDNAVSCGDGDHLDFSDVETVGDVIDMVNEHLCASDVSNGDLEDLNDLIACALDSGDGEDEDGGDDLRQALIAPQIPGGGIRVRTLSGNPLIPSSGIQTRLELSSQTPVVVQFGIYDAQGRLVARLLNNVAVAGQKVLSWNGRNLNGDRVPAGTYFYRATGPNTQATGKILVLK